MSWFVLLLEILLLGDNSFDVSARDPSFGPYRLRSDNHLSEQTDCGA